MSLGKSNGFRFALVGAVGIFVVVVLSLAWYLVSPLFIDQTVNEDFPVAAAPAGAEQAAPAQPSQPAAATAQPSQPAAAPAQPTQPSAAQPTATLKVAEGQPTQPPAPQPTQPPAAPPQPTQPPAAPSEPVALSQGQFTDVDAIHKGSGAAVLYQLPDGQRVLRFENFNVTNGPDLYVYLSGHPAPRNGAQLHDAGDYEVAVLKGNVGNQNYTLPADLDLSRFKSVVIYCKQFSVVFSTAELTPAGS